MWLMKVGRRVCVFISVVECQCCLEFMLHVQGSELPLLQRRRQLSTSGALVPLLLHRHLLLSIPLLPLRITLNASPQLAGQEETQSHRNCCCCCCFSCCR